MIKYVSYSGSIETLSDADIAEAAAVLDDRFELLESDTILVPGGSVEVDLYQVPDKDGLTTSNIFWRGVAGENLKVDAKELSGEIVDKTQLTISVRHAYQSAIDELSKDDLEEARIKHAAALLKETGLNFLIGDIRLHQNFHILKQQHVTIPELRALFAYLNASIHDFAAIDEARHISFVKLSPVQLDTLETKAHFTAFDDNAKLAIRFSVDESSSVSSLTVLITTLEERRPFNFAQYVKILQELAPTL